MVPNSIDDLSRPSPSSASVTRTLAISSLRRAASARDPSTSINSTDSINSNATPTSTTTIDFLSPNNNCSSSDRRISSDDRPLNSNQAKVSLERTASLLARSMAMAKLTGEAPPAPPANFYSATPLFAGSGAPLPTLEALRERAALRKALGEGPGALRRNNTVTGVGSNGTGNDLMGRKVSVKSIGDERAEARVNLMRKLSSRRLESPAPSNSMRPEDMPKALEVVGRRGRARPRSSSLPLDWIRAGSDPEGSPLNDTSSRFEGKRSSKSITPTTTTTTEPTFITTSPTPQANSFHPQFNSSESSIPITERNLSNWEHYRPSSANSDLRPPMAFGPRNLSISSRTSEFSSVNSQSSSIDQIPVVLRRGSLLNRGYSDSLFSNGLTFPTSISSFSSLDPTHIQNLSFIPVPTKGLNITRRPSMATFGIAAVEEALSEQRRGSSASSSLTSQSDIVGYHRALASGIRVGGSGLQTSTLGLHTGLGGSTLSLGLPSPSLASASATESQMFSFSPTTVESPVIPPAAKLERIERKRESGLTRSRDGAFPPPEEGYQFPGPQKDISNSQSSSDATALARSNSRSGANPPLSAELSATLRQRLQSQYLTASSGLSTAPTQLSDSRFLRSELPTSPLFTRRSPKLHQSLKIASSDMSLSALPLERSESTESAKKRWFASGLIDTITLGRSRGTSPVLPQLPLVDTDDLIQRSDLTSASVESVAMQSSYSSSNEMSRELSSSSTESLLPIPIRQPQLYEHQLPKNRILEKLETILGPQELDPHQPSILDRPPRHLLLHTSVLQVVNASTVKDRHLFLFSDLLVIAKPMIEFDPISKEPFEVTLDSSFTVKSVVTLTALRLTAAEEVVEETKQRHPLLVEFVDRFANDPKRAINSLVQKGKMANDGPTIANLLFRNQDLNRNQVGAYLASPDNRHILRSYIERFRFNGVRIDDALRIFYLALRLPNSRSAMEYVLGIVANHWTEVNISSGFDPLLTTRLVFSIISLSETLHPSEDEAGLFSYSTRTMSVEEFITNFRKYDPRLLVSEDLLNRIYASVRQCRIESASDNSMFTMTPDIEAIITPTRLPSRLTYRTPSETITIKIPSADPKFAIKLHGTDLVFDPPFLNFAKSATQSFKVTGCALGIRAMVLIKQGENASRYQGLPLNKAFSIERAFMQHTFQLSFINHIGVKRKYMFSTFDASIRNNWIKSVKDCTADSTKVVPPTTKSLLAAQTVAGQVLQDVLIPPILASNTSSAAPKLTGGIGIAGFLRPGTAMIRPSRSRAGTPRGGEGTRSNSFSKTYAFTTGREEAELGNNGKVAAKGESIQSSEPDIPFVDRGIKTGHEIALITEQNSLLPIVLSFLSQGASAAPHPMSTFGSAFQLPALPTK